MKTRKFVEGSGNVFADLDLPDAESQLLKAEIVAEILRLTTERGLTQTAAATVIGISQPEVSRLFRGHFREYGIERLMRFLTRLDQDVEIRVKPRGPRRRAGRISFSRDAA
jgi:predicted XRE-type DNA-binding protein